MSFDGFLRSLRDDLVEGGKRRRRFERRRSVVLAATPVLLLLALVGGLVVRDTEDSTDVRTDPTAPPSTAAEACAVWGMLDDGDLGELEFLLMRDQFVPLGRTSGDAALAAAAEQMATAEGSALLPAMTPAVYRCDELGLLPESLTTTTTSTIPGTLTPSAIATCDAAMDLHTARTIIDVDSARAAYASVTRLAQASDDPVLRERGAVLAEFAAEFEAMIEAADNPSPTTTATPPDEAPFPETPLLLRALNETEGRCQQLRAPGWYADVVLGRLGPEPNVALEDYGTVTPLDDRAPSYDDVRQFASSIIGRGLSVVSARRNAQGSIVARWTYEGPAGQTYACEANGDASGGGSSCGPMESMPARITSRLDVEVPAVGAAGLPDDVAFVVLQIEGESLVQRPADGMVLIPVDDALDVDRLADYDLRAYDADGAVVACADRSDTLLATDC